MKPRVLVHAALAVAIVLSAVNADIQQNDVAEEKVHPVEGDHDHGHGYDMNKHEEFGTKIQEVEVDIHGHSHDHDHTVEDATVHSHHGHQHDDDHGHSHDHRDLRRPIPGPIKSIKPTSDHVESKDAHDHDHDHSHVDKKHDGHSHDHLHEHHREHAHAHSHDHSSHNDDKMHSHDHSSHSHDHSSHSHHHHNGHEHSHDHSGHSHDHRHGDPHDGHSQNVSPSRLLTSLKDRFDPSLWSEALFATALVGIAPVILLFFIPLGRSNLSIESQKPLLRIFLSFAAGGLLGDALLHLLPHSLPSGGHDHAHDHNHGDEAAHSHSIADLAPYLWTLAGLMTFLMLEKFVRAQTGEHGHSHGHSHQEQKKSDDKPTIAAAGYLNLAADFSHNFTDGLAIGATFVHGRNSGWQTTLAMLLHEVPHEIGDFAILIQSGFTRSEAMWTQLYTAIGAMVGTVVGLMIEAQTAAWITPFTAGGFVYIACTSVFPELLEDSSFIQSFFQLIAMATGIPVTFSYSKSPPTFPNTARVMNGIGSQFRPMRNNAVNPNKNGPSQSTGKKGKPAIPGMHRSASKHRVMNMQTLDREYFDQALASARPKSSTPKIPRSLKFSKNSNFSKSVKKIKLKAQDSKTYIINPKHSSSVKWDIFMGILIAYSGVTVPLLVCFPGFQTSPDWVAAGNAIDVCFGFDIFRNFLVGFHDERDELVANHREIARKYLKTWFVIDFVSTFPIDTILNYFDPNSHSISSIQLLRVLRVARIVKLARLAKLKTFFAKVEETFGLNAGLVRLVRLVLFVLFISHLLACFFHLMGQPLDPTTRDIPELTPPSWLCPADGSRRCLREEDDAVRYLYSLYWVITTLTGVGFGDVHITSTYEKMYAICAMIIGASVFGFVIGNISTLLESMDKRAAMYQMKMMFVKDYIRTTNLPKDLRIKLRRYFEHYFSRASLFDESAILGEISLSLRNEIVHETCKDIFQIPAFSLINPQFVMDMAICIKPLFLLTDSIIAKEHTVGREMYFLNSGVVAMYNTSLNGKKVLLEVMSENAYFGEAALLYFSLRENTFQSVTNCEMYTLLKEDFDVLVEEYPETEGILIEFHEQRKKLYQETLEMTMKRYDLYDQLKDDDTKMQKFEDYCPHLKVCYNGHLTAIEQLPMEILRNIDFYIAPNVSLFNSSFAKKVIVDGIRNQDLKAKHFASHLIVIIDPNNPRKVQWDVLLGVLILYNVISIPIQVAFLNSIATEEPSIGDIAKSYFDNTVDCLFAADIVLTFRTAYFDSIGTLIRSSRLIARHYFRLWFWIDFISTFPFGYVINKFAAGSSLLDGTATFNPKSVSYQNLKLIRIARLIRLLKLARLLKFNKNFGSVENVVNLSPGATRLCMLFLQVCMIAHLSSCAFFFVGTTSEDMYDGVSWISDIGITNASLGEKYVNSLYFAFTTMATVGYGDILPVTHLEVAYVIFYMLVGASVFGYIIGSMSTLVDRMQTKSTATKEKIDRVKDYMKERKLPKPLCRRIRRYFDFYLSQKELADESAFLEDLSDDLRTQLVLHLNRDVVSKISFFSHQDDACISYLMGILYQECCTPGEYIFYEGEFGRHMYFLVKGTVQVVIHAGTAKEIICKVLTEGSFFGELAMLLSSKRCASVRAKTYGILYVLSRNGMDRIHTHYPEISNQITREIRNKLQKIKIDTLAQPDASKLVNHLPQEETFTIRMEQPIEEALKSIDQALVKLMVYYGGGEKGKRRSVACIIQHLKKFDFNIQSDTPQPVQKRKASRRQSVVRNHINGNPRDALMRASKKIAHMNRFLKSMGGDHTSNLDEFMKMNYTAVQELNGLAEEQRMVPDYYQSVPSELNGPHYSELDQQFLKRNPTEGLISVLKPDEIKK